jgi:hypothetical protein
MAWMSARKRWIGSIGLVLALLAGVAWFQRDSLRAWYYVRQLAQASAADRDGWVERAAGLDCAVVARLLDSFQREDAQACDNVRAALARIAGQWPANDARWRGLAEQLAASYRRSSPAGQCATLELAADWLRADPGRSSEVVRECAGRLLAEAARDGEGEVRRAALELAVVFQSASEPAAVGDAVRDLVHKGLTSATVEHRVRAIQLAALSGRELLARVPPLLSDLEAEVRQAAMLAVGPLPAVVPTDNLLPWLHDPDAEVRRLCEAALLAREDFRPEYLSLARLITAPQASARLRVLDHLQRDDSLEPGIWLLRLSHDPAPEVRAAAVRAAASQSVVDLRDRLDQIARDDPSPTVSQLARYYLSVGKPRP